MPERAEWEADLLTVEDVADLLCLSRRTVWRWSAAGRLPPPLRLGPRCTRWRVADLQRYVDALPLARPA